MLRRPRRAVPGITKSLNPYVAIPNEFYYLAWVAIFLHFALVVYISAGSSTSNATTALRLSTFLLHQLVVCSPLLFRWKGIGIVHPLYFLSAYTFLRGTLPNTNSIARGVTIHPGLPGYSPEQIAGVQIQVILVATLSWVAMIVGFRVAKGIKWARFLSLSDNQNRLTVAAGIGFMLSALALVMQVKVSGGFTRHIKNITTGIANQSFEMDSTFYSVLVVLVTLSVLLPCVIVLRNPKATRNISFWLSSAGSVVLMYLSNGRRSSVLQAVLAILACWFIANRRVPLVRSFVIACCLFLSVGLLGRFRESNWKQQTVNYDAFTDFDPIHGFENSLEVFESRGGGGAIYPIIAKVSQRVKILYGRNYFDYLNRFIPRFIWKNKPRGIGIECAKVFYGRENSGGIPPGPLGEAFWTGGWLGVFIVFLVWGAMLKSIKTFFDAHGGTISGTLIYLFTITTLNPSEPSFRRWLFIILPCFVLLAIGGMLALKRAEVATD